MAINHALIPWVATWVVGARPPAGWSLGEQQLIIRSLVDFAAQLSFDGFSATARTEVDRPHVSNRARFRELVEAALQRFDSDGTCLTLATAPSREGPCFVCDRTAKLRPEPIVRHGVTATICRPCHRDLRQLETKCGTMLNLVLLRRAYQVRSRDGREHTFSYSRLMRETSNGFWGPGTEDDREVREYCDWARLLDCYNDEARRAESGEAWTPTASDAKASGDSRR